MADVLTKEQRRRNMAAIHGKNTKPEILVRKFLFSRGFRYRLNHPRLPGHPDIVLRKYRTVIFVNGSFLSRSLFRSIFFCQKSMFVLGRRKYLQLS